MSYQLELLGSCGKFSVYQVLPGQSISTAQILDGTTASTLDKSRVEARPNVIIDRAVAPKKGRRGTGDVRF